MRIHFLPLRGLEGFRITQPEETSISGKHASGRWLLTQFPPSLLPSQERRLFAWSPRFSLLVEGPGRAPRAVPSAPCPDWSCAWNCWSHQLHSRDGRGPLRISRDQSGTMDEAHPAAPRLWTRHATQGISSLPHPLPAGFPVPCNSPHPEHYGATQLRLPLELVKGYLCASPRQVPSCGFDSKLDTGVGASPPHTTHDALGRGHHASPCPHLGVSKADPGTICVSFICKVTPGTARQEGGP